MIIRKKRIRAVENYLTEIENGKSFYIGLQYNPVLDDRVKRAGFTLPLSKDCQLLPSITGGVTRFNAEGRNEKQKHLPKETAYRQHIWTWKDWGGNEHSKVVDIPYKRYPIKFVPPPAIELSIIEKSGRLIITSPALIKAKNQYGQIKHAINLFLELFGECQVLDQNFHSQIKNTNLRRLNWTILPPGKYPWKKVHKVVGEKIQLAPLGNRPIIRDRIETISKFSPDFVALGNGGFNGYMVFGFEEKNIYVLESIYNGNATYIFDKDWQRFSKLTKQEILTGKLQSHRFIHRDGWKEHINTLLVA